MGLKVVGAGVGQTGTASLKLALERLLGARCDHMREVRESVPPSRLLEWTPGDGW